MSDKISGLVYVSNYINDYQHDWIIDKIDKGQWLNDLKRRVQHYGYKYDYRARKIDESMRVGELPEWMQRLSKKLFSDGHINAIADQVIVNEYLPGQGISAHIDCEPCFDDIIISLSLCSSCVMDFTEKFNKTNKISYFLEPKSIVVLSGEARYRWMHSITPRKTDVFNNQRYARSRRVSLTFRKVMING